MKEVNSNNFGLLIAYLVPGSIALFGIRSISPPVDIWLSANPQSSPTISGFLFGTIAAISAGMIINAIRWHIVDPLIYASGVPRKPWDYPRLADQVPAFQFLVANQFRYYECYANSMVAIGLSMAIWAAHADHKPGIEFVAFLIVQLVLWSASRRTLSNYNHRIAAFLRRLDDGPPLKGAKLDSTTSKEYTEKPSIQGKAVDQLDSRSIHAPTGIQSDN